jgi:UDP-N-acetylglucosamine 1-carboxyvinyltransferase
MDRLWIEGGRPLRGAIAVSGSKNATLPLMAAACLAETPSTLFNVPALSDIETMLRVLMHCGCGIKRLPNQLWLEPDSFDCYEVPWEIVRKMRASVYMLGPMLARHGRAKVSLPGGCAIGTRPIDLHLKGLEALGAKIEVRHGFVHATAPKLIGARFDLAGPSGSSVGATANCLMAAVLAQGTTVIESAARESDIVSLAEYLNEMGAHIEGAGTSTLTIEGVDRLYGARYSVIPDRIEAGTYIAAVLATRGEALLQGIRRVDLGGMVPILEEIGCEFDQREEGLVIQTGDLKPANIVTEPHPGFPTDMQAQVMAVLSTVPGESRIKDTIYPDRFMHVAELNRMGARIERGLGEAVVRGVAGLTGAQVMASDLRASAALVVAGLMAEGETIVDRLYHLDRGYERIEEKLTMLGANIERLSDLSEGENIVAIQAG